MFSAIKATTVWTIIRVLAAIATASEQIANIVRRLLEQLDG